MIVQDTFNIKIASRNIEHYKALGYKNIENGQIITVKNKDVPQRSRVLEIRKCDCCSEELERPRCNWIDSFNAYGKDVCPTCSKELRQERAKETIFKKFGVPFPMQSKEIREKAKQTCLEHYGCEYSFQNEEFNIKARQQILDKYGVNAITQLPKTIEKIKATNLQKYGVENTFQVAEFKEKTKATVQEKYGCDYISQNKAIREKAQQTLKEHYGVEHALQNEQLRQKAVHTTLERYGYEYSTQSPELRAKINATLLKNGNAPTSAQQLKIYELLKQYYPEYQVTLNAICSKLMLDIELIVDNNHKIDIEYDGEYWHRDSQKDRKRDEFVKTQGYKVLRIKSRRNIPDLQEIVDKINFLLTTDHTFTQIQLSN